MNAQVSPNGEENGPGTLSSTLRAPTSLADQTQLAAASKIGPNLRTRGALTLEVPKQYADRSNVSTTKACDAQASSGPETFPSVIVYVIIKLLAPYGDKPRALLAVAAGASQARGRK
jgi:hypothetical protein